VRTIPAALHIPELADEPGLIHGFSTVLLGSVGLTHAPDAEPVLKSRMEFARILGLDGNSSLTVAGAVHGADVARVHWAPGLIEDVDAARRELGKLRDLGVRLAVDDFGTGYSSVGYVRQFPLDSVKIDKSFVQGLTAGAEDAAIAQAIIKMAHAMGMTTVAEGVESAAELARLQQLGCDLVQGFYFSAPLTADAVDGLLRAGREVAVAS